MNNTLNGEKINGKHSAGPSPKFNNHTLRNKVPNTNEDWGLAIANSHH
jgi:hypothetical protein